MRKRINFGQPRQFPAQTCKGKNKKQPLSRQICEKKHDIYVRSCKSVKGNNRKERRTREFSCIKAGLLLVTILFTNYKVMRFSRDLLVRVVVYLTRHPAQFDYCVWVMKQYLLVVDFCEVVSLVVVRNEPPITTLLIGLDFLPSPIFVYPATLTEYCFPLTRPCNWWEKTSFT